MGQLCGKSFETVSGRVTAWKQFAYGHSPDLETQAWMRAGYDGWTRTTAVQSITPYSLKDDPPEVIETFSFTWLPYMDEGVPKPGG